jgi:hypothetical protein
MTPGSIHSSSTKTYRMAGILCFVCVSLAASADAEPVRDDAVPGARPPALLDEKAPVLDAALGESSTDTSPSLVDSFVDGMTDVGAWLVATEGYRVRGAVLGDEIYTDQDARFFLDAGVSSFSGRLQAHVSMLLFVDTDGDATDGGLYSVRDQGGPIQLLPQTLEARYGDDTWLRRLSVGRFVVLEGWPMTLDGAALTVAPLGHMGDGALFGLAASDVFVSAGRTVHFYEVDDTAFEDWSASVGTNLRLMRFANLQLDYRALVEDIAGGGLDHTYGARLTLRATEHGTVDMFARGLNAGIARAGIGTQLFLPWNIAAVVRLDGQPTKLDVAHEQMNPYLAVLGPSMPWARATVEVSKSEELPFGTIALRGGWNHRARLVGADRPFNRSYGRAYLGVDVTDLFFDGIFVGTRGEYHYLTNVADDGVLAAGGMLGYQNRFVRFDAGTDYQRYKIVYYRDVDELVDVQSFYAGASVRLFDMFAVRADYQIEMFDRVVHTANVSLVEDFSLGMQL